MLVYSPEWLILVLCHYQRKTFRHRGAMGWESGGVTMLRCVLRHSRELHFFPRLSISVNSKRGDIIRDPRSRLAEDTTLDMMESSLEADIPRKIPNDVSEMYRTCFNCSHHDGANHLQPVWQKWRGQPFRFVTIMIPVETVVSEF